jgi:ATP-dependent Lon protease
VKGHIEIVPVKWIDKVLEVALESMPKPLPEEEAAKVAPAVVEPGVVKAEVVDSMKH